MRAFVLQGLGIECELEMARACQVSECFESVEFLRLGSLLETQELPDKAREGDWVFLPGGFSFSDHFGSGKLLSLKLKEIQFFEKLRVRKLNVLGICNGFQILTEAELFGEGTKLGLNKSHDFEDRWVFTQLQSSDEIYKLPVRHKEGSLSFTQLPQGVEPFLRYNDKNFDNGSKDRIAGLIRKEEKILWVGMMPHPEIALSKLDEPDRFGADHFDHHRVRLQNEDGDGLRLLKNIFKKEGVFRD